MLAKKVVLLADVEGVFHQRLAGVVGLLFLDLHLLADAAESAKVASCADTRRESQHPLRTLIHVDLTVLYLILIVVEEHCVRLVLRLNNALSPQQVHLILVEVLVLVGHLELPVETAFYFAALAADQEAEVGARGALFVRRCREIHVMALNHLVCCAT